MKSGNVAINLRLMSSSRKKIEHLTPVTKTDIYTGATKDLDPEGLFSPAIFGRMASEERLKNYSYIDLKVPVFHPLIFNHLRRLKGLYVMIMSGTAFAKWDAQLGDFVRADEGEGRTGYSFFAKHVRKIKFKDTGSTQRELRVDVLDKYKNDLMRDTCVVISAGVRDIMIAEDDGRESYDTINDLYKKLIAVSNTIVTTGDLSTDEDDLSVHDHARWNIQKVMNEIYDYLFNVVFGKDKLVQSKWASRNVFNGTRNVITALTPHTSHLDAADTPEIDSTQIGIYQLSKSILPKVVNQFLTGWTSTIIDAGSGTALLINPKTGKAESKTLKRKTLERWTTFDGVNKILTSFESTYTRARPVEIDGSYLGYLYQDDVGFKLVSAMDIENNVLTKEQLELCKPITMVELLYIAMFRISREVYGIVTRYPIIGPGSTYPSKVQLRSTVKSRILTEYVSNEELPIPDEDGNVPEVVTGLKLSEDPNDVASHFPILDNAIAYFDSMAIATASLAGLDGDYDGDMTSFTAVYGKQSVAEIKEYLDGLDGYLDPRGGSRLGGAGKGNDMVEWVARGFTLGLAQPE